MNKKNTVIRLIGAVCLAAFVLTGCFGTERHLGTHEELEQAVAQKLAGEPFECLEDDPLGRTFRTTDRNIEFMAYWDNYAEDTWGNEYPQSSQFKTNYDRMVHEYWANDIEARLSECSFAEAVYNHVDERYASNARIYFRDSLSVCVFIDDDASEEQIEEVNAFLMFLRDLCICENEFHDGEYVMRFSLCVRWVEPGSDVYYSISDGGFDITSDTSDEEIDVRLYGRGEPDSSFPAATIRNGGAIGCYIRITAE